MNSCIHCGSVIPDGENRCPVCIEGFRQGAIDGAKDAVVEACVALVDRLVLVTASPEYGAVWALAQDHFGTYSGPKYEDEFNAAAKAVAALRRLQKGKA